MKNQTNTILQTEALCKYYGSGDNLVKAVDHIDLQIMQGEFVSIIGKSGSGKSTLLHMLGALDNPTSGKVYLDGENIASLKADKLSAIRRRKIGFIFQSFNLIPALNVWENIVLPLGLDGKPLDEAFIEDIVANAAFPIRSRADSSSAVPSREPSPPNLPLFWRMSPPVIWTLRQATK